MATTTFTYVSLENLQKYDSLLKPYIDKKVSDGVSNSLKTVSLDGNTLKFYTVAQPVGSTAPVFSIDLPSQDLGGFLEKFSDATAGDVVIVGDDGKVIKDSGIKLTDLAKTADVEAKIAEAITNSTVSVDTTTTSEGMLKSYTIKQGKTTLGVIDIPKDMVVKSGVVEENPAGQAKGTYLVLTLANATEDKVYINVGTLVDIYTAEAGASQIQLAINPSTREISATIVAGSVGTTELADGAVTTVKIADGVVTKAKLATEVQTSLTKADSALQEADIADLKKDVAANKASLAEGGATDAAIKAAKKAADDAQATADEAKTGVTGLDTRVKALEDVKYVAATEEEITALFPTV